MAQTVTLKTVENNLPEIAQKLRQRAANALNRAALQTEALAKELAPVDTGFLKNSIAADTSATEENLNASTEVGADYGIYVELGTSRQAPQPFITPAFEQASQELKKELGEVLK